MERSNKGIVVYCASSTKIAEEYFDAARRLGTAIAQLGVPVINGAGRMGLMAAVTDGALAAGGTAIGVIPQFMVDAGRNHPGLTRTIVTKDMHERKSTMASLAMGAIALPGGIGTLEELAEMMTWRKLGLFKGPVVIFNYRGYYDALLEWLDRSVEEGFTSRRNLPWVVAGTTEEAVRLATAPETDFDPMFTL